MITSNSTHALVNPKGLLDLQATLQDLETVKDETFDRWVYIILYNGLTKKINRSGCQCFYIVTGEDFESAINDFNTTVDHDMIYDDQNGWSLFSFIDLK